MCTLIFQDKEDTPVEKYRKKSEVRKTLECTIDKVWSDLNRESEEENFIQRVLICVKTPA